MKRILLVISALVLLSGLIASNSVCLDSGQPKKEVKMDSGLKKKLDTFFSNFSEAGVEPFVKNNISNKALIFFGMLHCNINKPSQMKTVDGGYCRLEAKYVEKAVEWYFGRKLEKHESVPPHIRHENGYYYIPGADGEAYTFSQIIKFVEIGNGFFVAIVDVWRAPNWWKGNSHGTLAEWRKNAEDEIDIPERIAKMTATIRKIGSGASQRYILVEWQKAH